MDDETNSIFGVLVGEVDDEDTTTSTSGTSVTNASPTTESNISFINKSKDGSGEGLEVYIAKATVTAGKNRWTLTDKSFDNTATTTDEDYQINIGIDVDGDGTYTPFGTESGISNGAKSDVTLGITLDAPVEQDLDSNGRTTSAGISVAISGKQGSYTNATDVAQAFTIEWVISTKDYSTTETEE